MDEYVTTGDIARESGRPLSQITYALQRLRIVEDGRAGTYRLFKRERLPELLKAIAKIGRQVAADRVGSGTQAVPKASRQA